MWLAHKALLLLVFSPIGFWSTNVASGNKDVPDFAESLNVLQERNEWLTNCNYTTNVASLYSELRRVFVFELSSLGMNGIGNTLNEWFRILAVGTAMGRATFHRRNSVNCTYDPKDHRTQGPKDRRRTMCRMNPGLELFRKTYQTGP